MKNFYFLLLFLVSVTVVNAQSGYLDTSFGTDGFVSTVVKGTYSMTWGTVVQPDGKIVVVGQTGEPATYKAFAIRYNTDGTLDTSFGVDGKQVLPIGSVKSFAIDVALQSDGKIVMSGYTWDNVTGDVFVIRLNTYGSLDNSFGTDGVALVNNSTDVTESIAIQTDGKILIGGYTDDSFTVVRFNSGGTLDTDFGNNGWAKVNFGMASYINDIALQNDGKIVAAGFAIGGVYQMAAARLNADGILR